MTKFIISLLSIFIVSSSSSTIATTKCASDWINCREAITKAVFGVKELPTREPDNVEVLSNYQMSGFPSPGNGSGLGNVSWTNNMTKLTWSMKSKFLTLNATVFHTLSTTYRAPANYPPGPYPRNNSYGPGQPTETNTPFGIHPIAPQKIGDTILIYHNGHETASCTQNYDGVVDYFNRIGYDVMELMMPLYGCNQAFQYGNPFNHWWFEKYEKKGDHTLRYFIEPVALSVNYAKKMGYKNIIMVGLSGGGWTTTLASALIPDIKLSIPIAGSTPKWPTDYYNDWVPDLPEGRNHSAQPGNPFVPPPMYVRHKPTLIFSIFFLTIKKTTYIFHYNKFRNV